MMKLAGGDNKNACRAWRTAGGSKGHWLWMVLMLGAAGVVAPVYAQVAGENALKSFDVSSLSGDRVQLRFSLEKPAQEPISFTIDNPARIALDFPDTRNQLAKRSSDISVGVARRLTAAEARGRTRVVVDLVYLVPYETKIQGNDVILVLDSAGATQAVVSQAKPAPRASVMSTSTVEPAHGITNVDFRRGELGEGRVVVSLSDGATAVNIGEFAGKVVVEFMDTQLPEALQQRLDVMDFATPVTLIDTLQQGSNVRMEIEAKPPFEHLAYQSENLLTIEVKEKELPDLEELRRAGDESAFTGERLSLNFQDIEVRAVLQLIADFTGKNLVTSDTVAGGLTLRLQNVPWDQALDIILRTKGLAMREMGNVMYIAPAEEIAAREKQELESQRQIEELEPLFSDLVQINYAKATDVANLLRSEGASLLSPRGNVTVDERTNNLLIQDTADKLSEIRKLINTLDIPVQQVLIESRIVIANSDFGKDLGVRFGINRDTGGQDGSSPGIITGNLSAVDHFIDNEPIDINSEALNVNLPVTNPAGQIALALAKLPFGTLVDLELSAMQAEGKGEVVSTPRVITANQKEAFIEQGVEVPFQEASASGATSVSFKKAVLSLRVTPHITPDERVIMDLQVTKDSVGQVFEGVPSINTREINTQVLVDNGETVVLGGVYEQSTNKDVTRVPFFGELPLIGVLFRSTSQIDDNEELLIFITPKVVREGISF